MASPSEAASSTLHPSPTTSTSSQHLATSEVPLASPLPTFPHYNLRPPLSRDGTEDPIVRQAEIEREAWSPDSHPCFMSEKEKRGEEKGYFAGTRIISGEKVGDVEKPVMASAMKKQGRARSNTVNIQADEMLKGPGVTPNLRRMTSQPPVVCPMGSVTPADDEHSAYPPVRSREDAEARENRRLQKIASRASRRSGRSLEEAREGVEEGSEGADVEKDDEEWMVRWDEGEKANPKNWSVAYRWYITAAASLLVLNSTFASSAPSGVAEQMMVYFGFGTEVATLTIALFVAGYTVGPLLWGPLSETYGRRPIFLIAFSCYTGFQVGCALSRNTASILVFRFLGGLFASCPLTNAGALLADIWDADRRGIAMSLFSLAPFAGPALGPIVGGFIGASGASWRWLFWVLTMFAGFCFFLIMATIPETYGPRLLQIKAKRLRKSTGEDLWWAPLDRTENALKDRAKDILVKPFKLLAMEPILQAVTAYMSFVYGCIYLLFEAFPIVFSQGHHFNSGITGLMFLGVFIGGVLATALYIVVFDARYRKIARKNAPNPTPPEARLEMMMVCAPLFVTGFFIFGWTSYPSLPWIGPAIGGAVIGFATLGIFVSSFNFLVDTYLFAAASALSANTVIRSLFGAGFPLFATQMYVKLNPRWASTLLGFVALLLAPIPFLFHRYGADLRAKSKYSPTLKL